nr:N-acyl homoserine lactonase family protein [Microbacterium invictum]
MTIRAFCVGRAYGLPKPSFTYMRNWQQQQDLTLIMFVIEGGDSPIIVDTGADVSRAPELHGLSMEQLEHETPQSVLRECRIDPADVKLVVNTHLHWDHSSNNHLFPNAEIVVQRAEFEFAQHPVPWHRHQYEALPGVVAAWQDARDRVRLIEGDVVLAPGVTSIALPGHTPGSQGVLVEAGDRRYLIAGDLVYLYENWAGDEAVDHIPVGLFTDLVAYGASLRKVEGLGCEVIPSHDARVVERHLFN